MKRIFAICILSVFAVFSACDAGLPVKDSQDYSQAVRSFFVGLAAMQASDDLRARKELENAVTLAKGEPAAWANLGILQMRQKDFQTAKTSLNKAKELAPKNGQIYANLAVLELQNGDFEAVKQNLQKAIESNPEDLKAAFALAAQFEREGDDKNALAQYENILQKRSGNLSVILEIVRIAAKEGDLDKLKASFSKIDPPKPESENEIVEQYNSLKSSVQSGNAREVAQKIAFFRNVLLRLPEFRAAIEEVKFDNTTIGEPFSRPLLLPVPDFSPAEADTNLSFKPQALAPAKVSFNMAVYTDGDSPPVNASASENELLIGSKSLPLKGLSDIQTIDIDYDFKNDFVAAGENGLRFLNSELQDITAKTKIPENILQDKYLNIFIFDIESDGDLDLIFSRSNASPVVLQNNADGTFKPIGQFSQLPPVKDFVSADLDEDGDIDAVFLDADSKIHFFRNERAGQFEERDFPVKNAAAIAAADANGDGKIDLILLQADGALLRATDKNEGAEWETSEILRSAPSAEPSLTVEDFDNNGANDFLISASLFLGGKDGIYSAPVELPILKTFSAADFDGDGKLDIAAIDKNGAPLNLINQSSKNYAWQIIRPRSANAEGDQRVNSFGIGGEMEIRSGLLAQKRMIRSPQVHFGLGEQSAVDLLRIVWGNGFIQAEFDLAKDQQILVKQRLTGSCPHMFAWNGTEFKLVKDSAPLATSLGLRVSNDEILPVSQTEEWYKISGSQLAAKDGKYEIRITDELWESYYVDHYSLMVIDHPEDTEVFANELYPVPVPLKLHATGKLKSFTSAIDEKGNDVSKLIEKLDEIHLDTFEEGRFQGVAKEHFVELEIPPGIGKGTRISIVADGWLHPTDTSLNVAISQSDFEKPKTLSLDVQNEAGEWKTVKDDFGVPAGKLKTVVVKLPESTRRARLRTNSEVFWDRISWAENSSENDLQIRKLELSSAELRFRGFSVIEKKNDSSPEIPDYNRIATTIERWRSIEGYYTRYGDIRDLLLDVDDRYAIVSAGDEMRLQFDELPPVKPGFKRDFIIIGDGWIKEGDYNNVFSKTVLPLPSHLGNDYSRRPTTLEDDPVYKRHSEDWQNYHTRYVAPTRFLNAMRKNR